MCVEEFARLCLLCLKQVVGGVEGGEDVAALVPPEKHPPPQKKSLHAVLWWMVVNMAMTWLEMTPIRKVYTESIVCSGRAHRIFMLRTGLSLFQARGQCLLNTLIMLLHKCELENSILVRWESALLRFEYPRIVIASLPSETLARMILFFSSCILTPQIDKPNPPSPTPAPLMSGIDPQAGEYRKLKTFYLE